MQDLKLLVAYVFDNITVMELGIALFGCTAIWVVSRRESWHRWGYILGLCAQPFWFIMLYRSQRYLVLAISPLYAYSWAQGVWLHWLKRDAAREYLQKVKSLALRRGISEKAMLVDILSEYFDQRRAD